MSAVSIGGWGSISYVMVGVVEERFAVGEISPSCTKAEASGALGFSDEWDVRGIRYVDELLCDKEGDE
jgi:hypothetical protein